MINKSSQAIGSLPEISVREKARGKVDPVPGSVYTGQYAIVEIAGQDKLSILFASKVGANDGVRYVLGHKNPVFGADVFAQRESYMEAVSSRLNKTALKDMPTPVRDAALVDLQREQRRLDHNNSSPITGTILGKGAVEDVGKQTGLTGAFTLVSNPKASEFEAAFETVGDVFELELPRDSNTEYFFDNETGESLYDLEGHYRLSHIWLIAARNRFAQANPEVDYGDEYPVHAAALAQLDALTLKA